MTKPSFVIAFLLLATRYAVAAPAPVAPPVPPLHDTPETLVEGYRFTEGPALAPDGSIYFTDIPANRIVRFDPATGLTADFNDDSGGANGLMFHGDDLYACEGARQRVAVYPAGAAGALATDSEPVVAETDGVPFNKPNDLALDAGGGVYFTDPNYGERGGARPPFEGVYYQAADGALSCVADDMVRPNGVALHPDGSLLYVHDNGSNLIYVWDVTGPGRVENRRLFADVSALDGGGIDGLCIDTAGRVYSTLFNAQAVVVHDAEGNRLQVVPTGPQTTNCVLDAAEGWLYVTADKGLKRIRVNGSD